MSHGDGPDERGARSCSRSTTWGRRARCSAAPGTRRPRSAATLGDAALPRLLDALDDSGLRATFFVEAINCELNPEALAGSSARGHELGVHGWQHEEWGALDADDRARAAGAGRRGRSPASDWTSGAFGRRAASSPPRTPALLRALGFDWCSPAGDGRRRSATASPSSRSTGSSSTPTT